MCTGNVRVEMCTENVRAEVYFSFPLFHCRIQIQVERSGLEMPTSTSTKDDISLVPQVSDHL